MFVFLPLSGTSQNVQSKAIHYPFYTKEPLRPIKTTYDDQQYIYFKPNVFAYYEIFMQVIYDGSYYTFHTMRQHCMAHQEYKIYFKYTQRLFEYSKTVRIVVTEDSHLHPFYFFKVHFPEAGVVKPEHIYNKRYVASGKLTELVYNQGPRYLEEVFHFTGYDGFRVQEFYHKFNLRLLDFAYNLDPELVLEAPARLIVSDPNHIFPKFPHDQNKNFSLNLQMFFNPTQQKYYFEFSDYLFYEKTTMIISPYFEFGWSVTKNFYFPLNSFSLGKTMRFSLEVGPLGYNQIQVNYLFNLISLFPYYSRHHDSSYYLSSSSESVPEWGVTVHEVSTDG